VRALIVRRETPLVYAVSVLFPWHIRKSSALSSTVEQGRSDVNGALHLERMMAAWQDFLDAVVARVNSPEVLIEVVILLGTGLAARLLAPPLMRLLRGGSPPTRPLLHGIVEIATSIAVPSLWLLFLRIATASGRAAGLDMSFAGSAAALLVAWIVIRLVSHVVRSPALSRIIFVTAWSVAALEILGLLDRIEAELADIGFTYGDTRISALNVVRALIVLAILLWLTTLLRGFLERRITHTQSLTPTLQVLLVQALKILLPLVALLVALPVLGINLTALTVFGGALAIGAGLGLQRSVANLVSGFFLLSSGSIRPGDVIAVKDLSGTETFGRVTSISAHYLSLRTRAGKEYLIPNETFVTNGVENWTHSDDKVRLKIPFGVSYGCDPRRAMTLALEAAAAVPRVVENPRAVCLLTAFGDSAVEFELRIWIEDPMNGVANVKSECLLQLWDRLKANDIQIPFPQRDLHLVSLPERGLVMTKDPSTES
jgi:small-conductance mechanosensitive channel